MDHPDLRDAFGGMPAEMHDALMKTARSVKEEGPVKKRISAALVLGIVLGLAVIGTACAVFSSRTADFFGLYWNRDLGESLRQGRIAQIGGSVTIGDVVFTLDEVVCKDRALYGVGTARPVRENDVIIPMDLAEDPEAFAMNGEAQALAAKAAASGGGILTVTAMPQKIGVDEGTMLMPGCVGYYDVVNEDGSVTFSFEATDGFVISEGTSYQILMESSVCRIDGNGEKTEGTQERAEWTVTCKPLFMAGSGPAESCGPVTIEKREGYELITPKEYQETGTLPVWQAVPADFASDVDPEWFNRTGIASGAGGEEIRFADHAVLMLSPDGIFYSEFTDDRYAEAPSFVIVERAWVREWEGYAGQFAPENTALHGITQEEARAMAEEMMARLGLGGDGYACAEALDMSLERIRTMGAIWEQAVADGRLLVDDDYTPYDYGSIPAGEEGYLLRYFPLGVDTFLAGGHFEAVFYVNSRGIVYANIRAPYIRGDVIERPSALIGPDDAINRLAEEFGRSNLGCGGTITSIRRVALTCEAVRAADRTDGMALAPVWMILYQDEEAKRQDTFCHAFISAVDGTLIDASFR